MTALAAQGCVVSASTRRPVIKRPIEIKNVCVDPSGELPENVIWTLRPCTLLASK